MFFLLCKADFIQISVQRVVPFLSGLLKNSLKKKTLENSHIYSFDPYLVVLSIYAVIFFLPNPKKHSENF
jgi:hypothetical protein